MQLNFKIIILFFIIKFNLSYIFWKNFTELYRYYFNQNIKIKNIYQLPIHKLFWNFLKKLKFKKIKINKKIVKWIKTKKRISITFWMMHKKQIPPFFLKQTYYDSANTNNIQYDYLTNYFCILKKKNTIIWNDYIYNNKLLKLHDFRYKA